jgi:membrane fusion protein, multidrug efflux system
MAMAGRHVNPMAAVLAVALALGAAACGRGDDDQRGAAQNVPGPGGMMSGRGPSGGAARVAVVEVQPVARGSIARQVTVSGTIEPVRTIGVNSQLSGAVNVVLAQEGDLVRQGAVLARMDSREIAAQLAAAQAQLEVTRAAYERAEQLRERRVITLPEYERERTAYAAAMAQVDQLRTRLGFATVAAPVTGVVTEKRVESGDVVGNQARLFSIADVSQLVVRVGVSELDVVELANGDRVTISLDAFPGRELNGRIRRIFPAADPTTRLVPVEVVFDAESARIARPGFLARVTFDLATSENVLLLPVAAVLGAQGAQSVFMISDGAAARRTVTTGLTSQGRIEIVSGLDEGDEVVVTGNSNLREGMAVRVAGRDMPQGGQPAGDGTPAGPAQSQPAARPDGSGGAAPAAPGGGPGARGAQAPDGAAAAGARAAADRRQEQ